MSMYKLGDFEYWVLTGTLDLGDKAYGAAIQESLQRMVPQLRNVSLGAIHTTLYRLQEKGMVTSSLGEPTPERGGRAKRFFKVSGAGRRALVQKNAAYANATRLHKGHGIVPREAEI